NTAAAWTSSATMPAWASQSDGTYTARATATDKVGNTFTGNAVSFTLQNVAPATASVTTPADGSLYRAATVPAGFSGNAAEGNGGAGLNANSTTFTLQRSSDNFYRTGSAWQAGVFNLATSHSATTGNTVAVWTSSATLPTWSSQTDGAYTVRATATDIAGNSFMGSPVSFTLDKTAPVISVTAPANGSAFRAATPPAAISGAAADNTGGVGLNATTPAGFTGGAGDNSGGVGLSANSTTFTLQRVSDGLYWTGTAWQAGAFDLATTHNATTGGNTAAWTSSSITMPAWASESNGSY